MYQLKEELANINILIKSKVKRKWAPGQRKESHESEIEVPFKVKLECNCSVSSSSLDRRRRLVRARATKIRQQAISAVNSTPRMTVSPRDSLTRRRSPRRNSSQAFKVTGLPVTFSWRCVKFLATKSGLGKQLQRGHVASRHEIGFGQAVATRACCLSPRIGHR